MKLNHSILSLFCIVFITGGVVEGAIVKGASNATPRGATEARTHEKKGRRKKNGKQRFWGKIKSVIPGASKNKMSGKEFSLQVQKLLSPQKDKANENHYLNADRWRLGIKSLSEISIEAIDGNFHSRYFSNDGPDTVVVTDRKLSDGKSDAGETVEFKSPSGTISVSESLVVEKAKEYLKNNPEKQSVSLETLFHPIVNSLRGTLEDSAKFLLPGTKKAVWQTTKLADIQSLKVVESVFSIHALEIKMVHTEDGAGDKKIGTKYVVGAGNSFTLYNEKGFIRFSLESFVNSL